jgi:2-oxoglutarate dehydrogenase E1 component
MTDQSQNTLLHSSSFLQGRNADYVEQLHARYVDNPPIVADSPAGLGRAVLKALGRA